jgi:hypothetical protein
MMQLSEETKMPEIVTVSERKARETARRRAAALAVRCRHVASAPPTRT